MGYDISDERTHAQSVAPTWDRPREDVTFLALRGPDAGKRYLVKPPGGVMGREDGAAVSLRDPNVSRRAALIEFNKDGKILLTDLGSRNGVFVNGVQVSRAEIYDGNHVQLSGDTVLRVRFQDPAETKLLEEMLLASSKDALTGLANRNYIRERAAQELSYAKRHGEPLTLMLVSIDDFKKVVDADGSAVADKLLLAVSQILERETRYEDITARFGADELLVILRGTDSDAAGHLAERIRKAVDKQVFDVGGDVPIRATISVGLATLPSAAKPRKIAKKSRQSLADEGELQRMTVDEADELFVHADAALYKAKEDGKNRIAHWKRS